MKNTTTFIETLTAKLNNTIKCYYQNAPTDDDGNVPNSAFPFAVISGVYAAPLDGGESGESCGFNIDVWTDEKQPESTVQLEQLCDTIHNALHNSTISKSGVFAGHIGFENQSDIFEAEFDLSHRRLSFEARLFYYGG